jgi:enoyl-CoA hydratase/carnithine racemase
MMFTSWTYSGEEAVAMGLADRCVPDERLEEETLELVRAIGANSPHTNAIDKKILHATDGMDLASGLRYELEHSPGACADAAERLSAFRK